MKANLSTVIMSCLMVICLLGLASTFELNQPPHPINSSPSNNDHHIAHHQSPQQPCTTPSLYQYIPKFSLPLKDISKLLSYQFSHDNISDFEASNKVKLFEITYISKLLSDDQSQSSAGPFKSIVSNSQIQFTITYKLNITEGSGLAKKTHTFSAVTKVSNVSVSYEKEFKTDNSTFVINSVNVKLLPVMMTTTYTPAPTKTEEDAFDVAIKGTTQSLLTTLSKLFSNDVVMRAMQTNAKGDQVGKIYTQNPYKYQFYSTSIPIDLAGISYTPINQSLTTGMVGKFPQGNTFCSQFVPDFTNTGASLFISKEFVQNFVGYNVLAYPGWKNVRVDKKTTRSTLLQWQLLDLEFIVEGLWNDMGQFYQNEIYFTCDVKDQVSTTFEQQKNRIHQVIAWACKGFVRLNDTADWKVIDFQPRINHIIDTKILDKTLSLYVNVLQVIDCQFNEVVSLNGQGKYIVGSNGKKLATKFMESIFNDFRLYPIGDRFQVNSNANTVQVEASGNGIWII